MLRDADSSNDDKQVGALFSAWELYEPLLGINPRSFQRWGALCSPTFEGSSCPGNQRVLGRVGIAVMQGPTPYTAPMPYRKPVPTCGASEAPTIRTGLGGISWGFHVDNIYFIDIIVTGLAKAFRETRLTTAIKMVWIAAGSKVVQVNNFFIL